MKFIDKSKFDALDQKVKYKIIEAWEPTFGDILYNSKYNYTVLINEDFINNEYIDKKELEEEERTLEEAIKVIKNINFSFEKILKDVLEGNEN